MYVIQQMYEYYCSNKTLLMHMKFWILYIFEWHEVFFFCFLPFKLFFVITLIGG